MSYSGYKSSPRGSRGGYRGGGYRGSRGGDGGGWRGSRGYAGSSRGSGRGGRFSSSSGGGKWERDDSSSYESRSRYSGGGDRYSNHSRDDSSYRSYRGGDDSASYSSRDHSHRGASPDRKRIRAEYSPASSMHRSHDYGDGMEYSSRSYGSYEGKRMSGYGGADDRRASSFREERERIRSDDYQFRKPLSIGIRHSTPRGSPYRGRSSFSRGLRSSFRRYEPSSRGEPFLRKRTAVGSYGLRKPMGRTQEYLRRLKLYRIQRLRRLRERAEKEGSGDDEEGEEEEVEEEEEIEEEVTDEENEEGQEKEDEDKAKKDTEDEEMEVEGEEKKDDEKKKKKVVKKIIVKKIKRKIPKKKDDEKDKDESGENKDIQVTVKQDSEGRDVDAPVRKNYLGQPFIKLECPHCHTNCETFKDYMLHLHKSKHKIAMGAVTTRVSKALSKLRMEQRAEQKDIDEDAKLKNLNMRTFFCMTCKLNYRSLKSEHLQSEKHKEIKNFLAPYCKICRVNCKSPMQYENHICSLFHLKRKYFYEKKNAENVDGSEIDMDKFMVLDQVGSGEDDETDSDEKEEGEDNDAEKGEKEGEGEGGEEGAEKTTEKKVKKKKKQINLGSEYCKKINIYFCELCKTFLPRIEDQEQALAVHCRGSLHLRWYVRKKDDLALRKRAERIHRMREAQKKAETEIKEEIKSEPMDEDTTEDQPKEVVVKKDPKTGENMDEKVWGEVNADLCGLLKDSDEVPKPEDSDEDEDSRAGGRRYDRFKHSEKSGEDEKSTDEKSAKDGVVNGEEEDKDA